MTPRQAVGIAAGVISAIAWLAVVGLAIVGPWSILEGPGAPVMLAFLLGPPAAILYCLAIYIRRVRHHLSGMSRGLVALCLTVWFAGGAVAALPDHDGDGLWLLWLWFGCLTTVPTVLVPAIRRPARPAPGA